MTLSEKFIDYYNKIESYLKRTENYVSEVSFTQKIKNAKNAVVIRYRDELLVFGELRNAIVHNPRIDDRTIAEPHEKIVEQIEELHKKITNPLKVIPKFQFPVLGAKEDEHINEIFIEMKKKSFSQFPIFNKEDTVCELINTNTVSRWLSSNLEEKGTIIIENVKVKDLIKEIEFKNNYKFISRNTSIYDAHNLFIKQINTNRRNLDVLFITETGKSTEKLLGLITIEDIANMV